MTATFDISSKKLKRTFREKLSDFHQTSLTAGLFQLLLLLILIVPLIIFIICCFLYDAVTGKLNKPIEPPKQKEFLVDLPSFKIKALDFYTDGYYDKLKAKYNYSDDDLRDLDEFCFIESFPSNQYFTDKTFTYSMTDFSDGIILQEVNFEKTPCSSKIVYFDIASGTIQTIKELENVHSLTFDKTKERELNILLRYPGDKQHLTIKQKDR